VYPTYSMVDFKNEKVGEEYKKLFLITENNKKDKILIIYKWNKIYSIPIFPVFNEIAHFVKRIIFCILFYLFKTKILTI
jgi:hypothetical protein